MPLSRRANTNAETETQTQSESAPSEPVAEPEASKPKSEGVAYLVQYSHSTWKLDLEAEEGKSYPIASTPEEVGSVWLDLGVFTALTKKKAVADALAKHSLSSGFAFRAVPVASAEVFSPKVQTKTTLVFG